MNIVKHGKDARLEAAADKLLEPVGPANSEIALLVADALTAETLWGEATEKCFAAYRAAGAALAAKKLEVGHGNWIPWLKKNRPSRYKKADCEDESAGIWGWTARRWMRIAYIFEHAHPATIEAAQTVAHLFRLAGMLPEGGGVPEQTEPLELKPLQIVNRVQRWVNTAAPLLTVERILAWPAEDRARLREQLAPMRAIFEALD